MYGFVKLPLLIGCFPPQYHRKCKSIQGNIGLKSAFCWEDVTLIASLHPGKPNTQILTVTWILFSKKADRENICPPQRCVTHQDSSLAAFKIRAGRASKFSNLSYLAYHLGHLHQRWWAWILQVAWRAARPARKTSAFETNRQPTLHLQCVL